MNKITLTGQQAQHVIFGEDPNWEGLDDTWEILSTSRWMITVGQVFKHIPTEKFYHINWQKGATEQQEMDPYEDDLDDKFSFSEVVLKEVTKMEWVKV